MSDLMAIVGWVLYIMVALYSVSGFAHLWWATRNGGAVTQMSLFLWGLAITITIIFGLSDLHKLHILWLVPVGYMVSFTTIGRSVGILVGHMARAIFRPIRGD